MTIPAATTTSKPFTRQAIFGAAFSSGMFLLGWGWFYAGLMAGVHEQVLFGGLALIALVQMGTGLWAFVAAIRARSAEGMPMALTATTIFFGLLSGILGLGGVPLFVGFMNGMALGISGWGRPLRVRGKLVHPEVRVTREWSRGEKPDVSGLEATTKEVLAALWLQDASKEYGSVPAFSRLGWQMAALGAPADLAERCYHAALQEIDHARRCFALVEGYTGQATGAQPMPELLLEQPGFKSIREGFRSVAIDSLVDGCLIEDLNADAAAQARDAAKDPAVRRVLNQIANEERQHAELAWDILEFCLREGGASVRDAVEAELTKLPTRGPVPYDDELGRKVLQANADALLAHGRVPAEAWPVLYAHRRAQTILRAHAMLLNDRATVRATLSRAA